jgi:nucleotide-binding universal stress UspA family protein
MFKDIMLPVDGSHFSELALPLALRVARRTGARLHLVRVHTVSVQTAESIVADNYDELVRDWERDALTSAAERARMAGVAVTAELLDGPVVTALQRYIEAANIELVVMSTHGRSGIKRAVMGSVAEQCVRKTDVPILLLRPRADDDVVPTDFADWRRIMVPLDGSEESEAVLPHAVKFARLAGAELVLMRAAVAPFDVAITIGPEALKDYLARVKAQAESYLLDIANSLPADIKVTHATITAERAPEAIIHCAERESADLVAMATQGRSGWSRIAAGSVAEAVLHRAATPILLIKGATERTSASPRSEQNEPAHSGG